MLQQILTGQAKSFLLLLWALIAFVYFLPAMLAFLAGHRRFVIIAVLNVLLSPLQSVVLHIVWPGLFVVDTHNLGAVVLVAAAANLGPGWIALLAWSLRAGEPDPRLVRLQNTKLYDILAGLPLILWFLYGALQLRPSIAADMARIGAGSAVLYTWVQMLSLIAAAAFDLLLVWLLVIRDRPVLKARGALPRLFAVLGTFMGVGVLQLPVAPLTLPVQILAAVLVGLGSAGSFLVLWWLGKSFSIMPEARHLVTTGPYGYVRHPLYGVEIVTLLGTALQFAQPWAALIAGSVVPLLLIRSIYEERVLSEAYPEYAAYRARTKRFIPGVV
jgi:protein-S-isoprenylcysteine O-methyltransferase Ste14